MYHLHSTKLILKKLKKIFTFGSIFERLLLSFSFSFVLAALFLGLLFLDRSKHS